MRTRIVPFGCALVVALAGCGEDSGDAGAGNQAQPQSTTPTSPPITGDPVELVRRDGSTIAKVEAKAIGERFCEELKQRGLTEWQGRKTVRIEAPDGNLRCRLAK